MHPDSDAKVRQAVYSPKQFRRDAARDHGRGPGHRWRIWHWILSLSLVGIAAVVVLDREPRSVKPVASGILVRETASSDPTLHAPFVVRADQSKRGDVAGYLVRVYDWDSARPVASLLVAPGGEVATSLPLGQFRVEVLEGPVWYGPSRLFGDRMRVSLSTEALRVFRRGDELHGARMQLSAGQPGNFALAGPR